MSRLRAQLRRWTGFFRRRQLESELQAEFESHLAQLTDRYERTGMTREDARQKALREFGGVAQIAERSRDERRSLWLEQAWQDIVYATKSLVKARTFTLTAVLTLAMGIGINSALFSTYNVLALRPLPILEPETFARLVGLTKQGHTVPGFSAAEYFAYREGAHTLEDLVVGMEERRPLKQVSRPGEKAEPGSNRTDSLDVAMVSENYFRVLGGRMRLGRTFLPSESRAAAPVMVLSYEFWEGEFSCDPGVLGSILIWGEQAYTVIGVTAPEFLGHQAQVPAAWAPLALRVSSAAGESRRLALFGRMKGDVTKKQVKADLDAVAARRAAEFPSDDAKVGILLEDSPRFLRIPVNARSLMMLSPVLFSFGMVLVIACTNVANLLLARGISRRAEIGVRLTLGASRGRILRQLMTENVLLCVLGSVVGLGLGIWTLQILKPIVLGPVLPPGWLRHISVAPDLRVLAFTAVLTLGSIVITGLLPAFYTASDSLTALMRNESTVFGRRLGASRLRQLLIIVQVTVCLMLLSCTGVLVRNFVKLRGIDMGYDGGAVFSAGLTPNPAIADRNAAFKEGLRSLQGIPGVVSAAFAVPSPLDGGTPTRVRAGDGRAQSGDLEIKATFISAGFFDTFGIPLLSGRTFSDLEQNRTTRSVVVSETLARQLWPNQDAVGRVLAVSEATWKLGGRAEATAAFRDCEVVGVARDILMSWADDNRQLVYLPFAFDRDAGGSVFIRPRSATGSGITAITRAAEAANLKFGVGMPLSSYIRQITGAFYGFATLSAVLGLVALVMAAVGLHGLMSFAVRQRTKEIGIRIALGGTQKKVVGHFVRQGMRVVLLGLVFGLVGAAGCALLLEKVAYGLGHVFDSTVLATVTSLFALIALAACWLPARAAAKVDPMITLRTE